MSQPDTAHCTYVDKFKYFIEKKRKNVEKNWCKLININSTRLKLCISMYWPVYEFTADAPLEEAAATVARQNAVVLAAGSVTAHDARETQRFGFGHDL